MSYDTNRDDGRFSDRQSIPAELVPDTIASEGVRFIVRNKEDEKENAISCAGQTIQLPEGGYTKLYLLAAADHDKEASFAVGDSRTALRIQSWTGRIGEFYNRILSQDKKSVVAMELPFAKTANIAWFASHVHDAYPSHNEAYQYCYLYKYEISIPQGAKTITLPDDKDIKIVALTVGKPNSENVMPLQPLYDTFKGNPTFTLRP